jgi:hypothetical protein
MKPSSEDASRPATPEAQTTPTGADDSTPASVPAVFVGAWDSLGKRVPSTREKDDAAREKDDATRDAGST